MTVSSIPLLISNPIPMAIIIPMANMMNNPQVKARMSNLQKQNATRDRLRAKLEKKKNAENKE